MPRHPFYRWHLPLITLILIAFWLRLPNLFHNSYHPDEALFASWARLIGTWQDPTLLSTTVDKPPLLFYTQALFHYITDRAPWFARLPNFITSILTIPLLALGARRWHPASSPLLPPLFLATSPFAIQFAPSAFIDPWLTFWLLASIIALTTHHPTTAAFTFALGLTSKYQAALWLPLLFWLYLNQPDKSARYHARLLLGLLPPLLLWLLWLHLRDLTPLSLWQNQWQNYGGVRLSWSWELQPRLLAWLRLTPFLLGPPLLLLFLPTTKTTTTTTTTTGLATFTLGYFLLHWLLAIPTWDRYLLPLVPFLAFLAATNGSALLKKLPTHTHKIILPLLCLTLLLPALPARHGRYPLGATPHADAGAATIATYLDTQPYGTILYDYAHSWHWQFYQLNKRLFIVWFPHPHALLTDLTTFAPPSPPPSATPTETNKRFITLPPTPYGQHLNQTLLEAGYTLTPIPITSAHQTTLYQITP
ncbi:MAG TPA: glycosyltransferase family 39 protein [Anaerolineae bacterium]|nr:glycosyltransferase family 39 protein [Anaerolineae bacterium]